VGVGSTVNEDIADLVARTPAMIDSVSSILPKGFPATVSDKIFEGVSAAAARLSAIG
jgi:hypothetical protein